MLDEKELSKLSLEEMRKEVLDLIEKLPEEAYEEVYNEIVRLSNEMSIELATEE